MLLARRTIPVVLSALPLLLAFAPLNTTPVFALAPIRQTLSEAPKRLSPNAGSVAHILKRVHVAGFLDLTVVQQPSGHGGYVSAVDDQVTQFALAASRGNIGLLAHNTLAGRLFPRLGVGMHISLVYADGLVESFVVSQVLRYQALQPDSALSSFRDLADDQLLTAAQLFKRMYAGERHLTFQTCIARDGNLNWGRLFVVAVPISSGVPDSPFSPPAQISAR